MPLFNKCVHPSDSISERHAILKLQLIRSRRVGPQTYQRLMGEYGTAEAALNALPEIARAAGAKTYTPFPFDAAEREYANGRTKGAHLICVDAADYPAALAPLNGAPPVLWVKGRIELLQKDAIALVGARNASSLGTRTAKTLARDLGVAGFVIASGLARGIDTGAHLAALPSGTIAVMAGGVDFIYPRENQQLAEEIADKGLLMSEQAMGVSPQARHFPQRNRIISGLSRAVVVVEGAAKSGSLITAREALDQGRDVMAVPGHPFDARAAGCNILIRDGALLVRSAADVIEGLGRVGGNLPEAQIAHEKPTAKCVPMPDQTVPEAHDISQKILSLLSPAPIPEDQLIREINAPAHAITSQLVDLELSGKLSRERGGMLSLAV